MMMKVTLTKPLQGWQVDDDSVLLQGWRVNDNDKSDNIRFMRFEVSHVVWSYNLRSCNHGIIPKVYFFLLTRLADLLGLEFLEL